tara:strand:+ start:169 stop:327 length:159 start_codon:yes stop_codon:yes gene_type:complete
LNATSLGDYFYSQEPPFIIFGTAHLSDLAITAVLAVALPIFAKKSLTVKQQD